MYKQLVRIGCSEMVLYYFEKDLWWDTFFISPQEQIFCATLQVTLQTTLEDSAQFSNFTEMFLCSM